MSVEAAGLDGGLELGPIPALDGARPVLLEIAHLDAHDQPIRSVLHPVDDELVDSLGHDLAVIRPGIGVPPHELVALDRRPAFGALVLPLVEEPADLALRRRLEEVGRLRPVALLHLEDELGIPGRIEGRRIGGRRGQGVGRQDDRGLPHVPGDVLHETGRLVVHLHVLGELAVLLVRRGVLAHGGDHDHEKDGARNEDLHEGEGSTARSHGCIASVMRAVVS